VGGGRGTSGPCLMVAHGPFEKCSVPCPISVKRRSADGRKAKKDIALSAQLRGGNEKEKKRKVLSTSVVVLEKGEWGTVSKLGEPLLVCRQPARKRLCADFLE